MADQEVEADAGRLETPPKAGSAGTVPLAKPAIDALAEHLAIAAGSSLPSRRLFTRPDGRPLWEHDIENRWTTARKAAGLPKAHLHGLRHGGLSLTAMQGGAIADVKRRGRHRSMASALRYQHGSDTRDVAVNERLSEAAIQHRSGTQMARGVVADLDAARKSEG